MAQEPVPGATVAAEIAKHLDEEYVPYVLWGWVALGFFGLSRGYPEADFVIPDDEIEAAKLTIIEAGYHMCTYSKCVHLKEERCDNDLFYEKYRGPHNGYHPVAEAHFHVRGTLVSLLLKSKILFWLPDWKHNNHRNDHLNPPAPTHPSLTLSTDRRLPPFYAIYSDRPGADEAPESYGPTGPWTHLYPMRILTHSGFAESLIYLYARDMAPDSNPDGNMTSLWGAMWESMAAFVVPGRPEYTPRLRPDFQLSWISFGPDRNKGVNMVVPVGRLRNHLIETDEHFKGLPKYYLTNRLGWDECKTHMG